MGNWHPAEPHAVLTFRTVCHGCHGDGAVGLPRAAHLQPGEPILAFQIRPCALCDGSEWLTGVVPPL